MVYKSFSTKPFRCGFIKDLLEKSHKMISCREGLGTKEVHCTYCSLEILERQSLRSPEHHSAGLSESGACRESPDSGGTGHGEVVAGMAWIKTTQWATGGVRIEKGFNGYMGFRIV